MTARILVVDNVAVNAELLEGLLLQQYFEVVKTDNSAQALEICQAGQIDIVITDMQLPEIDGLELCRQLKDNATTCNIPIIVLSSSDERESRIRCLEAGADDYFVKPVKDQLLLTRLNNICHLRMASDELFQRAGIGADSQLETMLEAKLAGRLSGGVEAARILIIDQDQQAAEGLRLVLAEDFFVDVAHEPVRAVLAALETNYNVIILALSDNPEESLKLSTQLRAIEATRLIPIILNVHEDDGAHIVRALEFGVNDYLMRPLEKMELYARLRNQIKRKCYNELLRENLHQIVTAAVTDSLTGLHNRHYLDRQLPNLLLRAHHRSRPLSVVMLDIDHLKTVNDQYGHDAGDEVLREFSAMLRKNVRNMDVIGRLGGEGFVIILPDACVEAATKVAERVRELVAVHPFLLEKEKRVMPLTVSAGVSLYRAGIDDCGALFERAERALREVKSSGGNRVVLAAA